jgi:hypothetical protein
MPCMLLNSHSVAVLPELARDFQVTETLVNLTVALYMLSMSIFPLWW